MNTGYFEELRGKINHKLREKPNKYSKVQIEDFPWLYGALGEVPSEVMFICENPSIAGIKKADFRTVDGGPPDIEAQWWGGYAGTRFRPVLCELGLKTNYVRGKGGWQCYITNVIKEANVSKAQEEMTPQEKREQAVFWSDILRWEYEHVNPRWVFCLGTRTYRYMEYLQKSGKFPVVKMNKIWHYSARFSNDRVKGEMLRGIQKFIK